MRCMDNDSLMRFKIDFSENEDLMMESFEKFKDFGQNFIKCDFRNGNVFYLNYGFRIIISNL